MSTGKTTVMIEDMGDGIDRREGKVCRDTKKFYDILNFQITPGRKLKRRIPCDLLEGEMASSQVWDLNGDLVVFVSRYAGASAANTVTGLKSGIGTQVIHYDDPPLCMGVSGSADTILDARVSPEGHIVALISHNCLAGGRRLYLHVFDELDTTPRTHPTYVNDGAPPSFWSPVYPQHPYDQEKAGEGKEFAARLGVDNGRVYISRADGNVGYCALLRSRVWNTRSAEQILSDGQWFYLVPDDGVNSASIELAYYDLTEDDSGAPYYWSSYLGWAEFGCEGLNAAGEWVPYVYDRGTASPAEGHFTLAPWRVAGYLLDMDADTVSTLKLNVPAALAGRPHRFFAKARPTGEITSGCQVNIDASISPGTISYRGRTYDVPRIYRPPLTDLADPPAAFYSSFIGFKVDDSDPTSPTFTYVWSKLQPKDGTIICAQAVVNHVPAVYASGTVENNTSAALWGTGTSFTTDYAPNDYISFHDPASGEEFTRKVVSVTNNTTLVLDLGFPVAGTGYYHKKADTVQQTVLMPHVTTQGSESVFVPTTSPLMLPPEAMIGSTLTLTLIGGPWTATVEKAVCGPSGLTLTMDTPSPSSNVYTPVSVPYTPQFTPCHQFNDVGTPFYQDRAADSILLAGVGDAGYVASAQHAETDDVPVSLAAGQNRLFVQYPQSVLMYGLGSTFVPAFLSKQAVGAGKHTHPDPRMMDDGLMLPTEFGPRMFLPAGNNKDYMQYVAFGDALYGITLPALHTSAWWQNQSLFVFGSASTGVLWVMTYNREAKVRGWVRWTIAGVSSVDKVCVLEGTLLVISNKRVYQFNTSPATYRDSVDPEAGPAYKSSAKWLYSDFGLPRNNKKLSRLEVAGEGIASIGFYVSAANDADAGTPMPVVNGYTQGIRKVPLLILGCVIAPYIETTDESGMTLFSLGFDYTPVRR